MKTHNYSAFFKWVAACICALSLMHSANAQTVRLHGGTGVAKTFEGKKAALESQCGVKLEIVGNGAGRGLLDLANGQAEIALLAGSLKGVADAMNKEKTGSVDISQMKEISLITSKIGFFTNPSAGIKSVTEEQLRDILTGKLTNWKAVGGADQPIKVVLPFGADGARITLQTTLFPGLDYAKDAIVRNSSKDVSVVVAQFPGACAAITQQNIEGNVVIVKTEKELTVPWSLVVKGEPSGDVKKVIDAAKSIIK